MKKLSAKPKLLKISMGLDNDYTIRVEADLVPGTPFAVHPTAAGAGTMRPVTETQS